jgi:hypothetical protein
MTADRSEIDFIIDNDLRLAFCPNHHTDEAGAAFDEQICLLLVPKPPANPAGYVEQANSD